MKKRVKFMITAFRDGFQSVFGARVFTKDFLPAVEAAAEAGIEHFEAGGGARFQSLYFYSNEDAFDMMDSFRKAAGPNANLQTLARGINVVGLDSQPRDIINLHAKMFKKHGMTTIRNFDALNDVNNLIYSGQCIVDAGLKHEVCVTLMELPPGVTGAHDPEFYIGVLKSILDAGLPYDSICFKDASGTSTPAKVYATIKEARVLLGDETHISFHSHETAGTSILAYKAALEAGATQVDLSMAPASGGTCQPDIITMWHALRGTEFDLGIDIEKIIKAEEVFKECMKDYFMPPEALGVEPLIPFSPMPGGALTANTQMMRDNGILDRYHEVTKAMGEVVVRGGFGTSVTPVSQFYFQQAFNNAMLGPWKKFAEGYGKMVLGYFGKTPVPPDPEIVKLAQAEMGLEPTTELPIDINDRDPKKGIKAATAMLKAENLPVNDENIFIAAACKEKGIQYLKGEARIGVRKIDKSADSGAKAAAAPAKTAPEGYTVSVNNNSYEVKLDGSSAIVNGTTYSVNVQEGISKAAAPPQPASQAQPSAPAGGGRAVEIEAPMPGLVLKFPVEKGASVQSGDEILILESMKMETPVTSTVSGIVEDFKVSQGDQVVAGQVIVVIREGSGTGTPAPAAKPKAAAPKVDAGNSSSKPAAPAPAGGDTVNVEAPMPGLVLRLPVNAGEKVSEGDDIIILESMKMEMPVSAPASGTVKEISVTQGDQVVAGQLLVVIQK
jgi:pyruvate carboxylase subunit B